MYTLGFLKIDTIKGESQDSKHKDTIQVTTIEWGAQQEVVSSHGAGLATGASKSDPFTFQHYVDRASPILFEKCCTGEILKTATLNLMRTNSNGEDYEWMNAKFTNVMICEVDAVKQLDEVLQAGSNADLVPERVSFVYQKVEVNFTGGTSPIHGGYDFGTRVKA